MKSKEDHWHALMKEMWENETGYSFEHFDKVMTEYASQQTAAITADYEEVLADYKRLIREIDEIISGKDGMAMQASLCDLVGPIEKLTAERDEYRKALEEIANIPVNGLPHTPIARHALAKYPQQ